MGKALLPLRMAILVLMIAPAILPAQQLLRIRVTDAATLQPIAFANVYLRKARVGDVTDLAGRVNLPFPVAQGEADTIEISFIGYVTRQIPFPPTNDTELAVSLESSRVILPEIEVRSAVRQMNGEELIATALERIADNYPSVHHQREGLYRELIYENQRCAWLNEALINLHYAPYPQKSYARKAWKAYWDDNFYDQWLPFRRYRKNLVAGHPQFFKYYNCTEDLVYIVNSRKSDNWIEEQLEPQLWSGPLGLTAADKVKFEADFLDPKLSEAYEYQRGAAVMVEQTVCIAVHFKPKVLPEKIHHMWQDKVDFALFSGTVYLSAEDLAIVRIECQFAHGKKMERYQVSDPWQIYPERIVVEVSYAQQDLQGWSLRQVSIEQYLLGKSSEKWPFSNDYTIKRELHLRPLPQNTVTPPKESIPLQDIHQSNLRDLPVPYQAQAWQEWFRRGNYPQLTLKDKEALERLTPLEQQFIQFDQRN